VIGAADMKTELSDLVRPGHNLGKVMHRGIWMRNVWANLDPKGAHILDIVPQGGKRRPKPRCAVGIRPHKATATACADFNGNADQLVTGHARDPVLGSIGPNIAAQIVRT